MRNSKCPWLLSAVASSTLLAASAHADLPGTLTQLTTGSATFEQNDPDVSGDVLIWTGFSTHPDGVTDFDTWMLDLATGGSPVNLTNTPDQQEFLGRVSGSHILWTHTSAGIAGDIVQYDLARNEAATIASSTQSVHFEQPVISDRMVVFLRATSDRMNVYAYDNLMGDPLPIGFDPVTGFDPVIDYAPSVGGNLAVWARAQDASFNPVGDIYGVFFDIPPEGRVSLAGQPFPIATGLPDQSHPDTDGRTVVYMESVSGVSQIVAYDVASGAKRQLTSSSGDKFEPRVSGRYVVWTDSRAGNYDIYAYDLMLDREELLAGGAGDQFLAEIDASRVVFTDNVGGYEHVMMFTIAPTPLDDAQAMASDIIAQVEALAAQHILKGGNANALVVKLNAAIESLRVGDVASACGELGAFVNQVQAFVASGKLSATTAQPLLDAANAIRTELGC